MTRVALLRNARQPPYSASRTALINGLSQRTAKPLLITRDFARDDVSQAVQGKQTRVKDGRTGSVLLSRRLFLFRRAFMRRAPWCPRGFIKLGFHEGCIGGAQLRSLRGGLLRTYWPPPGVGAKCS